MISIDNDLEIGINGLIKTYEEDDDINFNKVKLYMNINKGGIPVSDYGNELYYLVFKVRSDTLINTIFDNLINKIRNDFNLIIDNFNYYIDNNEINFILYVKEKEIKFKGYLKEE